MVFGVENYLCAKYLHFNLMIVLEIWNSARGVWRFTVMDYFWVVVVFGILSLIFNKKVY